MVVVRDREGGEDKQTSAWKFLVSTKKKLCSTMPWSKAYPQKRMGPRTQESNKPDDRLKESLAPPTVEGADCCI